MPPRRSVSWTMLRLAAFAACLAFLAPSSVAAPGRVRPAADLDDVPDPGAGLAPSGLVEVDGTLVFLGSDLLTGREPWRSDGTAEGTRRVADTCPGTCGVDGPLVALGDAVYFASCGAVPLCQLWRSDGTVAGTRAVTRFSRGGARVEHLVAWDGALYFVAADAAHGAELWRSDGTREGTELVADTVPGPAPGGIRDLAVAAGALFFRTDDEVWTSDGTAAGTRRLAVLPVGQFFAFDSVFVDGGERVFFTTGLFHLWTSDGTVAGTREIADRRSGVDVIGVRAGSVLFTSHGPAGSFTRELWRMDGNGAGAERLAEGLESRPFPVLATADALFFGDRGSLWRSDGTRAGTALVAELSADVLSLVEDVEDDAALVAGTRDGAWRIDGAVTERLLGGPAAWSLTRFGERLALRAETADAGSELAVLDDHALTVLSDRVDPGSSGPTLLTRFRGGLLIVTPGPPSELWWVRDPDAPAERLGALGAFGELPHAVHGGRRAFVVGEDVWAVGPDGALVRVLVGREDGIELRAEASAVLAGTLYFVAWDRHGERIELWASDGTVAGTRRLDELTAYSYCNVCSPPQPFPTFGVVAAGDRLFAFLEQRLWTSDGGDGAAVELDLGETCGDCWIDGVAAVGRRVYFAKPGRASFPTLGAESSLWVSDGTAAGTAPVLRLAARSPGSEPPRIGERVAFRGRLYFVADTPDLGEELWRSDGTVAGTRPVIDLWPGVESSNPRGLAVLGGRLFFAADDGVHGHEPWVTRGAAAGTRLVADVRPGPASSFPRDLAAIDGLLYLAADDGVRGLELWVTRGTAADTRRIRDLERGRSPSSPGSFTAAGRAIYFTAGRAQDGFELWLRDRR